jgi:hypothetical protein
VGDIEISFVEYSASKKVHLQLDIVNKKNKTKKKPWWWDPIHQQAFDNIKAAIAKEQS